MRIYRYEELDVSDLVVDAIYESSHDGQLIGEPIHKLLPGTGNMGGIRAKGRGVNKSWVVLYTTGDESDWPDSLDAAKGMFTYYGDNRKPGYDLHNTPPAQGNKLLRNLFEMTHGNNEDRLNIPPVFLFRKYPLENAKRSVQFLGVAVPGHPAISKTNDLVAIWKSNQGERFQNYKGIFSLLNIAKVTREWINSINAGNTLINAPLSWEKFIKSRAYDLLLAEPTTQIRTIQQQLPDTQLKKDLLTVVWDYFDGEDRLFEFFAAKIYQMLDSRVIIDEVTRGVIDGGRDAIGRYILGRPNDPVYAEFALEAKCYRPAIGSQKGTIVGVEAVARLISRIKHREFGVLVTTSVIGKQAYSEVREDKHPIIFITGVDIVEILLENGLGSKSMLLDWLINEFPKESLEEA